MTLLLNPIQTLETTDCCSCGVLFAMPASQMRQRREDGGSFWCPNGHSQHFTKTESARLREEVDRLENQLSNARGRAQHEADQREAAERSARAVRGHNTRLKNRIAAGACPCCHERFGDLAQHMADQHPNYTTEPTGERP